MHIPIKTTNIELTDALRDYVEKKLGTLEKIIGSDGIVHVEIGKPSQHHQKGDVFKAEARTRFQGKQKYVSVERADMYTAIDDLEIAFKEALVSEKTKMRDRVRRGAKHVKDIIRGWLK